jgi:hypothetical protein
LFERTVNRLDILFGFSFVDWLDILLGISLFAGWLDFRQEGRAWLMREHG